MESCKASICWRRRGESFTWTGPELPPATCPAPTPADGHQRQRCQHGHGRAQGGTCGQAGPGDTCLQRGGRQRLPGYARAPAASTNILTHPSAAPVAWYRALPVPASQRRGAVPGTGCLGHPSPHRRSHSTRLMLLSSLPGAHQPPAPLPTGAGPTSFPCSRTQPCPRAMLGCCGALKTPGMHFWGRGRWGALACRAWNRTSLLLLCGTRRGARGKTRRSRIKAEDQAPRGATARGALVTRGCVPSPVPWLRELLLLRELAKPDRAP